ncbi:M1 family aminopeptidase [Hymenobacter sp. CA1UV-4]|nr:M1 family aminopeptidase [Hymenobacter sp. CA1UV-4]
MKYLLLLAGLLGLAVSAGAAPTVSVQMRVIPATHSFVCRYTMALAADDTATTLDLNLGRQLRIENLLSSGSKPPRATRVYYPYFGDTLQQVVARFNGRARMVSVTYSGTLEGRLFNEQVMVFSGHSGWLPFRPYREYEAVNYVLEVQAPDGYQVESTSSAVEQRAGRWLFRGRAGAIEITALVARQFQQLASAGTPGIRVVKAGPALARTDTVLLRKAERIIAYYNRSIGQQDPITQFTILLPGTNADAFGLLENATVITYTDFDVATDREALLILAHEISHKWWGYGSVHNYNDWLNEAFATYSSLLFLREDGDEAGYRAELAKRVATVGDAPPIRGFDYQKYPRPVYRRVVYNKGTRVLAALHERLGTAPFVRLLATVAAGHVSNTDTLLEIVAQTSGPATRAWLLAELSR